MHAQLVLYINYLDKWVYRSWVINKASEVYETIYSFPMCQYKQFEVRFIKVGAILDFGPLYKFEMTFDLHEAIILYNLETKH